MKIIHKRSSSSSELNWGHDFFNLLFLLFLFVSLCWCFSFGSCILSFFILSSLCFGLKFNFNGVVLSENFVKLGDICFKNIFTTLRFCQIITNICNRELLINLFQQFSFLSRCQLYQFLVFLILENASFITIDFSLELHSILHWFLN